MGNTNFLSLVGERIKSFFVLMKEGYGFKDKVIILEYYLKSPLHFFNYYLGIKNSRTLKGDVLIKNKYGLFFCGNNFSSLFGSCSMCEPVMRKYMKLEKGIAIDAGANCGMFTIPLARMLGDKGKVISIEPDKKNIEILRLNNSLTGMCTPQNYPNCRNLMVLSEELTGNFISTFITLCRRSSFNGNPYDQCEIAKLLINSE